jgi:hypothetical protein
MFVPPSVYSRVRAHGSSDECYSLILIIILILILILIPQPSPIRLVDGSLLMPGQTHLIFRRFCLFWFSTPLRGVCLRCEAWKSGVARNTACHRSKTLPPGRRASVHRASHFGVRWQAATVYDHRHGQSKITITITIMITNQRLHQTYHARGGTHRAEASYFFAKAARVRFHSDASPVNTRTAYR